MKENPNYYANLPADVRYSDAINPMEKLLYAEITCLSNFKGYCWATNKYFGKLFKRNPNSISRNLSKLALYGFIKIKMIRTKDNNVETRIITLVHTPSQKSVPPLNKKVNNNTNKEKIILFEEFWNNYNFKKSRKLCYDKFMNLSLKVCKKCVVAAKLYSDSITDIKFKKHPGTWLNQGCWDDDITDNNQQGFTGGGFDNFVF